MSFSTIFQSEYVWALIRTALTGLIGIPLVWLTSRAVERAIKKRLSPHIAFLVSKAVFWSGFSFIFVSMLHSLGLQVSTLLGTAGILGIALGFAAQTSISNIISGVFLLIEDMFEVGDFVSWNEGRYEGTIVSIDPLSIKVRTTDNCLMRVPNEIFLKEAIENHTYYPQRRLEFTVSITDKTLIVQSIELIKEVIQNDERLIKKPAPIIEVTEVSMWAVTLIVFVWAPVEERSDSERRFIRKVFDKAQLENIPLSITRKL